VLLKLGKIVESLLPAASL